MRLWLLEPGWWSCRLVGGGGQSVWSLPSRRRERRRNPCVPRRARSASLVEPAAHVTVTPCRAGDRSVRLTPHSVRASRGRSGERRGARRAPASTRTESARARARTARRPATARPRSPRHARGERGWWMNATVTARCVWDEARASRAAPRFIRTVTHRRASPIRRWRLVVKQRRHSGHPTSRSIRAPERWPPT